ncbi:NAD-dependent epimerase/dehydratase family protein [Mycobacterium parmense]|uniref:Oxidoreductase n=1 Tax=Mycobacterium parmense TaxID=185642 RepID=A0A7I7YS21_9MYCO|nr:NAD(P)-dependent oxidoreductase [Mycobacterium parmense]MCV7349593.1 NAD(P)-dependent oxidoreductase [Mycobacterium parmense]ORW58883.1 oxidoreductase [Mycobacterium parmense]BBZ43773.1 oxidoreductase [Mycobacterium parmense]
MTVSTILVTGGFGQVGTRCVQILLDRGRAVIATDLRTEKTVAAAQELSGRSSLICAYVDLLDADAVRDLVTTHRPEAIVHLAAIVAPVSYHNPALARKVNVGGTANLLAAASALPRPPLFLMASSAAVYGSRNPYRHPERITPDTPVHPIDQYGEDKVLAEAAIRASGLPYALLRLAGVISPDTQSSINGDHLVLLRSMPGDNRMHAVDARDVALAFANGVDRGDAIAGKAILVGGNESCVMLQRDLEDDIMDAVGLGRLGESASLPGDPDDDRGWSFTGWYDTSEAQALLNFQENDWAQTLAWIAQAQGRRRIVLRMLGPVLRPILRVTLRLQRRVEGRGPYADPWALIVKKFGPEVLAATD